MFVLSKLNLVKCLRVKLEPTQVEHLSLAPLWGRLMALRASIKQGWKDLLETNAIAYLATVSTAKREKGFITLTTEGEPEAGTRHATEGSGDNLAKHFFFLHYSRIS